MAGADPGMSDYAMPAPLRTVWLPMALPASGVQLTADQHSAFTHQERLCPVSNREVAPPAPAKAFPDALSVNAREGWRMCGRLSSPACLSVVQAGYPRRAQRFVFTHSPAHGDALSHIRLVTDFAGSRSLNLDASINHHADMPCFCPEQEPEQ